jgi:protein disulfide-isomerase
MTNPLLWLISLFLSSFLEAKLPVTEDFEKGANLAFLHHRPMVLIFTGSDWCVWSKKLLEDVINDSSFQGTVGNTFIFVKVDFPDANHQSIEILQENYELKERFHVQDFPTVILLDSEGAEITRIGYTSLGPKEYGKYLLDTYLHYQELYMDIKLSNLSSKSVEELERLYDKAHKLRSPHLVQKILEEGVNQNQGVFFPLEKYSQLLYSGKSSSAEAKSLRQMVVKRDPENKQGSILRLALLDFQANADDVSKNAEETVAPLKEFIDSFHDKEKETLMRLHVMISDYFHARGEQVLKKDGTDVASYTN